jgi:hypothetical protein
MRPMIEPAAGRLFDIYYQYTSKEDLAALQLLTEEAYKLHERLRKLSPKNKGLFELDEFLLLKALRNYSVHRDDFIGKAYAVKRQFAEQNQLELGRVCLIDKKVVRSALNAEKPLEFGEQDKVSKIDKQLVDFGEFYNIEPVIFNFMVKVYEKLIALKLTIPGEGFADIDKSYKNEIYHNFPHYVSLQCINVKNEDILSNITPLKEIELLDKTGLVEEKDDLFNQFSILDINYKELIVPGYGPGEYDAIRHSTLKKIIQDPNMLMVAKSTQKHIGMALVTESGSKASGEVLWFNINKQRDELESNNIELDNVYYETTAYELLVFYIYNNNVFPLIIYKSELVAPEKQRKPQVPLNKIHLTNTAVRAGRNDPCVCGSGKKYKKCCLH